MCLEPENNFGLEILANCNDIVTEIVTILQYHNTNAQI